MSNISLYEQRAPIKLDLPLRRLIYISVDVHECSVHEYFLFWKVQVQLIYLFASDKMREKKQQINSRRSIEIIIIYLFVLIFFNNSFS